MNRWDTKHSLLATELTLDEFNAMFCFISPDIFRFSFSFANLKTKIYILNFANEKKAYTWTLFPQCSHSTLQIQRTSLWYSPPVNDSGNEINNLALLLSTRGKTTAHCPDKLSILGCYLFWLCMKCWLSSVTGYNMTNCFEVKDIIWLIVLNPWNSFGI